MTRFCLISALLLGSAVSLHHDLPVVTPSAVTPGKHRPKPLPRASRSVSERLPLVKAMLSPRTVPHRHPQPAGDVSEPWRSLAECESGGNWQSSAGMFEGGLQFLNSTWLAQGGGRYAQHAYDATPQQQIRVAERLLAAAGWGQWPVCSARLGL